MKGTSDNALDVVPVARICDCVALNMGKELISLLESAKTHYPLRIAQLEELVHKYMALCNYHAQEFPDNFVRRLCEWQKADSITPYKDGLNVESLQVSTYLRGNAMDLDPENEVKLKHHKQVDTPTVAGINSATPAARRNKKRAKKE